MPILSEVNAVKLDWIRYDRYTMNGELLGSLMDDNVSEAIYIL